MAKIEFEVNDNVYEELKKFCEDTGLTENVLFSLYANKVAAEKAVPFEIKPFHIRNESLDFVNKASPQEIIEALKKMDDHLCAVFLSKIPSNYASTIIEGLPEERSTNILSIIAKGITVTDDICKAVEKCIGSEIVSEAASPIQNTGGINNAAEILNLVRPDVLRSVLVEFEEKDSQLAEDIKKEIFVFEDIVVLADRDIQKILREFGNNEIAIALKNAATETKEKIFRNMSKRAAKMLEEDMEFMGPVRLKDIDQMQSKIVACIRHMEEKGEICIPHGTTEDLVY